MFDKIESFVRDIYSQKEGFVALHEPRFVGNEKSYVNNAIDSTFVSSVGEYVNKFEDSFKNYVGAEAAVVTVNGTAALHVGLLMAGVKPNDLVITQALSFVATANAIAYTGAEPVFLDSDEDNLALSPKAMEIFLTEQCVINENRTIHKATGKTVSACVPMHVFGHPGKLKELLDVCKKWNLVLVEDAAESLGSYYENKHTGTFGPIGIFSFNGNKIITSGGGGAIVFTDKKLGQRAKHLTTTAKQPHAYEFFHDEVGYNYRMPNLNAALICAQLEKIESFVENKRQTAAKYKEFFQGSNYSFISEPKGSRSNYWLNAIQVSDRAERDQFLVEMNKRNIMCRPIWSLLPDLPMYKNCLRDGNSHAKHYENTIINLPSSVRL